MSNVKQKQHIHGAHPAHSVGVPIKSTSKLTELKQKIDGFSMKNPVHIEAYHIPYIINEMQGTCDKSFMITPKTDGLTCHITIDGHVFESEKYDNTKFCVDTHPEINETTFPQYYVFDLIRSSVPLSKKIESRIKTIQYLTRQTMMYDLDCNDLSPDELQAKIHDFITTNHVFGERIIIKPVIKIKNCKHPDIVRKLFKILSTKPITHYHNDGWIMYVGDHQTPLKFKPIDELTIDLSVHNGHFYARDCTDIIIKKDVNNRQMITVETLDNTKHQNLILVQFDLMDQKEIDYIYDNTIYRFLPQMKNDVIKIKALSKRPDKFACNRTDTVAQVVHRIKTNWSIDDVLDAYRATKHIYYDHCDNIGLLNDSISNLLTIQRSISKTTLNIVDIKDKVLLDLGCGNGSLGRFAICTRGVKMYYGIDIDPVLLGSNIGNLPNQCLIWGDPNKSNMEFFTKYEEMSTFSNVDVVTIMNSIHYFDLDIIMRICDLSEKKSKRIIIYGFFSENISKAMNDLGTDSLEFGESFKISKKNLHCSDHMDDSLQCNKDMYEFSYPWKVSSFCEPIYQLSYVIKIFKKYGWEIESCDVISTDDAIKTDVCPITSRRYESFITLHNRIVFKKFT